MDGGMRRQKILELLRTRDIPVSGTELAGIFLVSRQVIVQDVALLRADNKEILSTNKGYVIHKPSQERGMHRRVFCVQHEDASTRDELYTIVDFGGRLLDVSIEHQLYGQIRVDLIVDSRLDADEFVRQMKHSGDLPLKVLTGGCHFHTVVAPSEKNLDRIGAELDRKGYLIRE